MEIIKTSKFFLNINLSEHIMQSFVAKSVIKIYEVGEVIMREGVQNGDIYFLVSGKVSCRKNLEVARSSKRTNSTISKEVIVEYNKIEKRASFPEIILPSRLAGVQMDDPEQIFTGIKRKLAEIGYTYPGMLLY
jgi:hypothetical protein